MSLYGNDIEEYRAQILEEVEPLDESVTMGTVLAAAQALGVVTYVIIDTTKNAVAKSRLKCIENYYKAKDSKFVPKSELKSTTYACKKYFDGEYEKTKELKSFIFRKLFPDRVTVYEDENGKEIFSYFNFTTAPTTKQVVKSTAAAAAGKSAKTNLDNMGKGLVAKSDKDIIDAGGKAGMNKIISGISKTFFFRFSGTGNYSKYEYYYLSCVCIKKGQMVKEARNWIEREYNNLPDEYKK